METLQQLRALADVRAPCVTLFLNTRDEAPQARAEARAWLKSRIERALRFAPSPAMAADLRRVAAEAEVRTAIDGPRAVAIFACGEAEVFRVMPLDVPVENELVVGTQPALRQIARHAAGYERIVLALVTPEEARVVEVVMPRDASAAAADRWQRVRYQRRVLENIDQHLGDVVRALARHVDDLEPHAVFIGGRQPTLSRFRHELPLRLRVRATDVVGLAADAPLARIVDEILSDMTTDDGDPRVDGVKRTIATAMADGPAALGLDEVLAGARERRLTTLHLSATFQRRGTRCRECGRLDADAAAARCATCGSATAVVDLGEALERAVIAQEGVVDVAPASADLNRFDGVVARLRW